MESLLTLCEPGEICTFMNNIPKGRFIARFWYIKVSGLTLGPDPVNAHEKLQTLTRAYHLSDNNGKTDTNETVIGNSWFWDIINPELDYYSLEVYGISVEDLILQRELVLQKIKITLIYLMKRDLKN